MKPSFKPGRNIAMKIPLHEFDQTVIFYRDVLGLEEIEQDSECVIESVSFRFGDKILWLDKVKGISRSEIWLEILTDDIEAASNYFGQTNTVRCDDIEPLPDGLKAFWITNPSNTIHLISEEESP